MRWVLINLLVWLLVGCNGAPRIEGGQAALEVLTVHSGFPLPYLFEGSGVQWNEEYAVTVKHIPYLANVVHRCSSGCDLVFFRHRSTGKIPTWRSAKGGESVSALGFSLFPGTLEGQGTALSTRVELPDQADTEAYGVHDGPIVMGMSGGPVIGRDKAVLGITVGMLMGKRPAFFEFRGKPRLSLYLPYDVILREWKVFQRKSAGA